MPAWSLGKHEAIRTLVNPSEYDPKRSLLRKMDRVVFISKRLLGNRGLTLLSLAFVNVGILYIYDNALGAPFR